MQHQKIRDMVLCAIFSAIVVVMTVVPYTGYINYGLFIEITTLHIPVILGAAALGWKYGAVIGGVWGLTSLARAFTNPAWVLFTNPLISVLPRIVVGLVAGVIYTALTRKGADRPVRPIHSAAAGVLAGGLVLAALTLAKNAEGQLIFAWPLFVRILVALAAAAAIAALFLWLNRRYGSWKAYAAALAALGASLTNTVLVITAIFAFGGMLEGTKAFFELFETIFTTIVGINGTIELLAAVLITPVLTLAVMRQREGRL